MKGPLSQIGKDLAPLSPVLAGYGAGWTCKGRGATGCYVSSGLGRRKSEQGCSDDMGFLRETSTKIRGVRWKFLAQNKKYGPRDRETWVQIWTLSSINRETLGSLCNLSVQQFPRL